MRRILVVDDDAHVGPAIGLWLRHHGFRVSIADSGTSGLAALDNATFDLMIVDVFMPDMRGFEAIRLFHQRAPTIPLVAISGSAFPDADGSAPDFLRLAGALGATRCLRKPFKLAILLASSTNAWRRLSRIGDRSQPSALQAMRWWKAARSQARQDGSAGGCHEVGRFGMSGNRETTARSALVGTAISRQWRLACSRNRASSNIRVAIGRGAETICRGFWL